MNRYGLMAMDHWQLHAPRQYQELEDPQGFFTRLGEELADEIDQIASPQEMQLPPELPYWEKVQQLMMIRRQAEEVVLYERLWSIHEPSLDPECHLEEILNDLPSPQMITDELQRLDDRVARSCEISRIEFGYTQDEELHRNQLLQFREQLLQAQNPELSWEERIEAAEQANKLSSTPVV